MDYPGLREELCYYYDKVADKRAEEFCRVCVEEMDRAYEEGMSIWEMKRLQYNTISQMCDPIVFWESPFYYEMGTMAGICDGARDFRGHKHPGGWVYWKREHLFKEQDRELWEISCRQKKEQFYLICGPYNDTSQHFLFHYRPILAGGLKGIYERAQAELPHAQTETEREFLKSVCEGMLAIKRISEKFAAKAEEMLELSKGKENMEEEIRGRLRRIAESAKRTPWEKPESFYEALNTYAFLRKAVGSLEGVGVNSFGRLDVDLYPFYQWDVEAGILTPDEAYELICQFLITFDMHYDHDMKMIAYSDHELENTYVLGGCDEEGRPIYNALTEMFLRAAREEKIIYPKIKCRFSKESPKAYLDEINKAVIAGTSTVLYQNDDATIPAFVRAGRTLKEARDYLIAGCWDICGNGTEKLDSGAYFNLLKVFEYSLHQKTDKMQEVGIVFRPIDDAKDFEEVYRITLENIRVLLEERVRITRCGGQIWDQVDVLPVFSSTLESCLKKRKDYTAGGAKYRDEHYYCFGLPNIVDSLLAIKELCFDSEEENRENAPRGKYSLGQLLTAVRSNWAGFEKMRIEATRCHGWGDGSEESTGLANCLNKDLYAMMQATPGTYGGKIQLGHLTYTEIRWWGEKTLATPDGRKAGEYFAQGLTPSRLKHIPSVTSVINSLAGLDGSMMGGNSVVNIILPSDKITLDLCEAFLRAAAGSALQSLQLNCATKEQLLDAQKHPEKYPDLIVRVTGFSAKFTSLSPEWQQEVLTRNFYE